MGGPYGAPLLQCSVGRGWLLSSERLVITHAAAYPISAPICKLNTNVLLHKLSYCRDDDPVSVWAACLACRERRTLTLEHPPLYARVSRLDCLAAYILLSSQLELRRRRPHHHSAPWSPLSLPLSEYVAHTVRHPARARYRRHDTGFEEIATSPPDRKRCRKTLASLLRTSTQMEIIHLRARGGVHSRGLARPRRAVLGFAEQIAALASRFRIFNSSVSRMAAIICRTKGSCLNTSMM
ncbi:hypothetical protein CALCODRAFT_104636 [Calocera cornea HHB12733]|uniref:Uncharacterized protein n=1 Tax=Calocera cornea HHB12733 TaxID=1353952 RepID=A0A165D455_9BASI|nr:hypothetical protein CALCODRAFT_104636 [Calocera cornea HHB12733]